MDNIAIDLDHSPYYITVDKGNGTAYVLSGTVNNVAAGPEDTGSYITAIVYRETSGFKAGPTVALDGTILAVAADPIGHLVYAATSFADDGSWGDIKDYGIQIYDPSKNFEKVGFFPLPIPEKFDEGGMLAEQVAIYDKKLFVGADNFLGGGSEPGVIYVIENFSSWNSALPKITPIEDIESQGPGILNLSFFENRLYFAIYNSKNLICIDIDKKAVVSNTDVSDDEGPYLAFPIATAISPSKREIYVLQYNPGSVLQYNPGGLHGTQPDAGFNSSVKTLDISTEVPTPLGHIPLNTTNSNVMDIDDTLNFICCGSLRSDNVLAFIDTTVDQEAPYQVPMEGGILSVALDAENHRAFIANTTSNKVFCYARNFFPA